ncbi:MULTISPECIES: nuclear transport factor 2 family protein [unclassified Pseudoalteromonas]|uniref:nuclear transport factor 2 family protein n=1 Tax=unclassified Pseudoalteromonas TaxID=194690 RepID=UPI0020981648|nr:nuclear transport factor 2 family protein [Pseudoalteromonas sp. XMcav2-N]MCO7187227.1 nuclear transport factor 2 family protein [Pseudoalteromonas sp. XMcav2-N]
MAHTLTSEQLARGWIQAWIDRDMAWLNTYLAPDFLHISPFGRLTGREHYLNTVAPLAAKSVQKLTIVSVIAGPDESAIWFENHTPAGIIPSCDWLTIANGTISQIHSFYDSAHVRDTLTSEEQSQLNATLPPKPT